MSLATQSFALVNYMKSALQTFALHIDLIFYFNEMPGLRLLRGEQLHEPINVLFSKKMHFV